MYYSEGYDDKWEDKVKSKKSGEGGFVYGESSSDSFD